MNMQKFTRRQLQLLTSILFSITIVIGHVHFFKAVRFVQE